MLHSIFTNRLTLTIKLSHLCFIAIILTVLSGCIEDLQDQNNTQASLKQLMSELNAAVMSDNADALRSVISKANRINSASRKAKALILSTARAKLGRLQWQQAIADTTDIVNNFQLAKWQANQAAMLRSASNAMSKAAKQQDDKAAETYKSEMDVVRRSLNSQLEKARVEIARLSAEHTASKELGATLQTEADKLLIEAESLDDVTGFKPFKLAMNTQRKADIVRLSAVESQLASELIEARKVDDATAELEAIAKQLLSIRYSMELLGNYRQASREGAGELRRLADVRDSDAARVMTNAIDSSNEVLERWSASIELMQQAIKSQGRSSSRDKLSKAATDSWRLDVTWALGQMQESQGQFIAQKYDALTEILTAGIVTGTSKWEALASTCSDQLESAIASAITAYEDAKSVAQSLERDGESALYQLDIRLSNLTGTALPDSQQNTQVPPDPNTPSSVTNNGGFNTPQELVAFMKDALKSKSSIDLTKIYETKTAEHENMLGTLQKLLDNMTALSKIIDSSFGEGSSNKISTLSDGLLPSSIDESLINMQGDNKATLALEGTTVSLNKTNRGWLIDFDSQLQAEGLDQQKFSQVETMIKAFKKVADQIKSGEISDSSQVEFAIMTAMMGG